MEVTLSKWGNSSGIRIPKEVLVQLELEVGSELDLQVEKDKLILTKTNKVDSIHDLFKDYDEGSFKTELGDVEAVGNELW
ncbi:AbrB/MazE/SpoVT family DNA-binding domain-containing protein [Aerococcaceae bacterium DSM 111022]|nr:AbrB/MazE/SpoVT family DNA-binding domain-containing protein [Aerococcaceae bacterium DSM 111022]